MRNYLFISIVLFIFLAGCGKNKVGDKPMLKLDRVNTHDVPRNSYLRFSFTFTSGVVADSIFVDKIVPDCSDTEFSSWFKVPSYPTVDEGSMELTFVNGFSDTYVDLRSPLCGAEDSATFKFVLKDINGKVSDTVTSPVIVIY